MHIYLCILKVFEEFSLDISKECGKNVSNNK